MIWNKYIVFRVHVNDIVVPCFVLFIRYIYSFVIY